MSLTATSDLRGGDVVKADSWMHRGSDYRERSDHLDLFTVAERKTYDKGGNKKLLRGFRRCYFGSATARMTERRCEAFFNNNENFVLPTRGHAKGRNTLKPDTNPRHGLTGTRRPIP